MVSVIYFPSICLCIFTWRQYSVFYCPFRAFYRPTGICWFSVAPLKICASHLFLLWFFTWLWMCDRNDLSCKPAATDERQGPISVFLTFHCQTDKYSKLYKKASLKRFHSLSFDLREVLYVTSDLNWAWGFQKKEKKDQNSFEEYKFSAPCCLPVCCERVLWFRPQATTFRLMPLCKTAETAESSTTFKHLKMYQCKMYSWSDVGKIMWMCYWFGASRHLKVKTNTNKWQIEVLFFILFIDI